MKYLFYFIILFSFIKISHSQELETVIQRGHLGAVKIAVFSPDGKYLVTGGRDRTAKLWEVATGREMRTFLGHEGTVQAVCFTPDGKYVATGSTDNTVKLWNILNAELIRTYKVKDRVTSIDFTSDGKYIVIGGYDWYGKIFETATGKFVREFKVNPDKGLGTGIKIQVSKNNKDILVSEDNRTAIIVDFETGEKKTVLKSVEKGSCGGCGTFAKYTPDENFVISGTRNGPLVIWNLKTGKKYKTYIKEQKDVTAVDISSDGKTILISDKFNVVFYNRYTGKKIRTVKAHKKEINSAEFSPDGKYFITASDDGTAALRKTSTGKLVRLFVGYVNKSNQGTDLDQESYWQYYAKTYFDRKTNVKLSPDGKIFIIGKKDSVAKVLDFHTGKTLFNLKGHSGAVICFDFSPDSKMIATGSSDKTIKLWNAADGKLIKTFKGHTAMIFDIHFNYDGTKLLSSSWDGNSYIWNVKTGKKEKYFKNIKAFTSDFSKIGNYIVTGGLDKKFSLYEINSGDLFRRFIGPVDVVSSFDFSPDGRMIVSGSWDGNVCIWDMISGFQLKKINPNQGQIHSVAFSNLGKYIFSGGSDGTIKMWNAQTGKLLKTFNGNKSAVTSLQVSPDNQSLISCNIQGVVTVWEIVNAKAIYTYYQLTRDDWFVKTKGGFFDGNAGAKKYIYYVKGMQTFNVDQFFEDFYRPGLLQQAYKTRGLINENIDLDEYLKKSPPPSIKFQTLYNDSVFKKGLINIKFQLTDNGGGIDEIKVMQNGKRIITDFSGLKRIKRGKKLNEEIQIMLVPGKNKIQISAFSTGRIESNISEQSVFYESNENLSDCYVLTIGINKYENESLNLNYAKSDGKSFSDMIKKHSKSLFNNMYFYNLFDKNASKENIINAVNSIAEKAKPADVFIFYYAGHGSMIGTDFYFIPTNCIRIYDLEDLTKNAIDADFMQKKFSRIKALKQLMILDACQSGGATEVLAQRGSVKEKAIAQLSRSSGIHVLASAGSEQFAVEFKSLGHGLFTYVLLKALEGNADGSPLDGKVTVYELKSYLDDQVPEYTSKFKGVRQYPYSYSGGNDFPITLDSDK
ncbi:MAG: hypothetical protein GXO80_06690 [Chlorobi bacterium]|nr:hypothetical protein [Chlorobiota bacterium]